MTTQSGKPLDPEIRKLVDENFDKLLWKDTDNPRGSNSNVDAVYKPPEDYDCPECGELLPGHVMHTHTSGKQGILTKETTQ